MKKQWSERLLNCGIDSTQPVWEFKKRPGKIAGLGNRLQTGGWPVAKKISGLPAKFAGDLRILNGDDNTFRQPCPFQNIRIPNEFTPVCFHDSIHHDSHTRISKSVRGLFDEKPLLTLSQRVQAEIVFSVPAFGDYVPPVVNLASGVFFGSVGNSRGEKCSRSEPIGFLPCLMSFKVEGKRKWSRRFYNDPR